MNRTTSVAWLGLVLIAAGVIPALWAAGELMGGILEIPHHWWSGLAMVPLLIGVAITAFGLVRIRGRQT